MDPRQPKYSCVAALRSNRIRNLARLPESGSTTATAAKDWKLSAAKTRRTPTGLPFLPTAATFIFSTPRANLPLTQATTIHCRASSRSNGSNFAPETRKMSLPAREHSSIGFPTAAHSLPKFHRTAAGSLSRVAFQTAPISYKGHKYGPRTALWLRDLQSGAERVLMDPIESDVTDSYGAWRVLPGYAWARDGKSIVISQGGKIHRVRIADGKSGNDSLHRPRPAHHFPNGQDRAPHHRRRFPHAFRALAHRFSRRQDPRIPGNRSHLAHGHP